MPVVQINEQLLDEKLTDLEKARNWSPRVISRLETMIRTANDYDLFRINPIQVATEKGMSENEAIDLFLYGTKHGLFEMQWHLVCAICACVVESFRELSNLHSHFICGFCSAENDVALDDYIHVSFTISPKVRDIAFQHPDSLSIEDYYFKYHFSKGVLPYPGGYRLEDVFTLITKLMTYVMPQEKKIFEIDLAPGMLQAKDLSNNASLTFFLGEAKNAPAQTLSIHLEEGKFRAGDRPVVSRKVDFPIASFQFQLAGELAGGKIPMEFANLMDKRSPLWVVHYPAEFQGSYAQFEPFLSGKRLLTSQTFRDLFRSELIQTNEGIGVQ
ncbi:MAG: DUF5939 domain-containing protein, partial [Nitrospira sp.]|nr:DUF5939 domain-containing protein [Nitrospira sp.]